MLNKCVQIARLKLTQVGGVVYEGNPLNTYDNVMGFIRKVLGGMDSLCFAVCAVDRGLNPLCIQKIDNGLERSCEFSVRDALTFALASSAYGIIVAHNNVFENLYVSEEDMGIVMDIKKKGLMLGIQLIDYVVIDKFNGNFWFLSDNEKNIYEEFMGKGLVR